MNSVADVLKKIFYTAFLINFLGVKYSDCGIINAAVAVRLGLLKDKHHQPSHGVFVPFSHDKASGRGVHFNLNTAKGHKLLGFNFFVGNSKLHGGGKKGHGSHLASHSNTKASFKSAEKQHPFFASSYGSKPFSQGVLNSPTTLGHTHGVDVATLLNQINAFQAAQSNGVQGVAANGFSSASPASLFGEPIHPSTSPKPYSPQESPFKKINWGAPKKVKVIYKPGVSPFLNLARPELQSNSIQDSGDHGRFVHPSVYSEISGQSLNQLYAPLASAPSYAIDPQYNLGPQGDQGNYEHPVFFPEAATQKENWALRTETGASEKSDDSSSTKISKRMDEDAEYIKSLLESSPTVQSIIIDYDGWKPLENGKSLSDAVTLLKPIISNAPAASPHSSTTTNSPFSLGSQ